MESSSVPLLSLFALVALLALMVAAILFFYRRHQDAETRCIEVLSTQKEAELRLAALNQRAEELEAQNKNVSERLTASDVLRSRLETEKAVLEDRLANERRSRTEQKNVLQNTKDELSAQFKNVASDILEAKAKSFTEQNQSNLTSIIAPLKDSLTKLDAQIVAARAEDARERQKVSSHLDHITDLGLSLTSSADNLTHALRGDNKAQGNWGEMVLEKLLDGSGLKQGRDYEVQKSQRDEEGKLLRPDVVLWLPENKAIVIDSKVSLNAYDDWMNADDDQVKRSALKAHIRSIRTHIKELGRKDYQDLVKGKSLDFVLMFIPIDFALISALENLPSLFEEAREHNIGLVCPSLLMVTLRMIENLWRIEQQNENADAIGREAGALYGKFVGFVNDLETVGTKIDQAHSAYKGAFGKLATGRGNLVKRAENLKKLGARTSKALPENLVLENDREQTQ